MKQEDKYKVYSLFLNLMIIIIISILLMYDFIITYENIRCIFSYIMIIIYEIGGFFMKYMQLKKLFHINENECNQVYLKRFNGEFTNRLNIMLKNGYECFYLLNNEMLSLIDQIYSINTWLEKIMISDLLPHIAKKYLIMSSMVEEIKSSNQLEGIYSTRKELKDIMVHHTPKKYKRFYGMVNKYEKLSSESFALLNSVSDIRRLYDEILLKDILNEDEKDMPDGVIFRKGPVEIQSSSKIIHKGIEGEDRIIDMLEKALRILNDESINFLIRIAIFHYLFEYIHPFYNGNGRMGRFLASGYLSKNVNILCALQFSIACIHNNKQYYDAFTMTNDIRNKGDLTVFIINFLEIYLSGLQELKSRIENLVEIYNYTLQKINIYVDSKYMEFVSLLLQATLFDMDGLEMSELVKLTQYTQQTIRSIIKNINKEYAIINIDNQHKPYKYTINLDVISSISDR